MRSSLDILSYSDESDRFKRMIFRRRKTHDSDAPGNNTALLAQTVREQMPGADDDAVRLVSAVAGLLACVAYADREFSDDERQELCEHVGRLPDLSKEGVNAICELIGREILDVTAVAFHTYTRDLYELTAREVRIEVLEVLMEMAAADDVVSMSETNMLRRIAAAFRLSDAEYLAIQARHRDRLSVLK